MDISFLAQLQGIVAPAAYPQFADVQQGIVPDGNRHDRLTEAVPPPDGVVGASVDTYL